MHLLLRLLILSGAFAFPALAPASAAEGERGRAPAEADLCNEDGTVKYAARWAAGKVRLTASGTHRTGGFSVRLQQGQEEIFPPHFSLVHQRPRGIVTQAITPFTEEASFPAATKPKTVTVRDARGAHPVEIE